MQNFIFFLDRGCTQQFIDVNIIFRGNIWLYLIKLGVYDLSTLFVSVCVRVCVCAFVVSFIGRHPWSLRCCRFNGQEGDPIEDSKGITACLRTTHFLPLSIQVCLFLASELATEQQSLSALLRAWENLYDKSLFIYWTFAPFKSWLISLWKDIIHSAEGVLIQSDLDVNA